jgi:hypothetical protein
LFQLRQRVVTLPVIGLILLLAAILVWLAPLEQSLGVGIKVVYVHVALIWTGMTGLMLAGVLGLGVLVSGRRTWRAWTQVVGGVATAFFAAGMAMSLFAAQANWGAVFWAEPRALAMSRVLAIAIIVAVVNRWPVSDRLKGLLHVGLAVVLVWSVFTTSLVLHPQSPIRTSPSLAIQFSFFGLFVLTSLAAVWCVLYLQGRRPG